jgi:hypothetical protein
MLPPSCVSESENSRVSIFVWCITMIEFCSNVKEIYCLLNTWTGVAWKVGTTSGTDCSSVYCWGYGLPFRYFVHDIPLHCHFY